MFRVRAVGCIDSTNEAVKRALEAGESEGLAVRAYRQTGGYGRQGRTWESPEGGLYQSLLLRPQVPPAQLPTLALAASVAVRRAIASLVVASQARLVAIKWPNDVVMREGDGFAGAVLQPQSQPFSKLAGISAEVHAGGVCLGIGVNVNPPAAPLAVGGKNRAAYLADAGFGFTCERRAAVDEAGDAVLREFESVYALWQAQGFKALVAEYNECSILTGRAVRIVNREGAQTCSGEVREIDESGYLVVRDAEGRTRAITSGEAHIAL